MTDVATLEQSMARKRRIFSGSFKAKVALEAIKGHRTISEMALKHKLHATQVNLWKKQLIDGVWWSAI